MQCSEILIKWLDFIVTLYSKVPLVNAWTNINNKQYILYSIYYFCSF